MGVGGGAGGGERWTWAPAHMDASAGAKHAGRRRRWSHGSVEAAIALATITTSPLTYRSPSSHVSLSAPASAREGEEWGGDDDSRSHSSIGDRTSASQSGAASASGASLPSGASGPIGPNGPSGGPVESPTRASTRASTGKRDLSRTILPSEETAFKYVDLTLRGV